MSEPILTWNLFLTAFLVPACLLVLGSWMKRQFAKRDEKDDRIAELINEREIKKEEAIMEWRQRFQTTLCDVKTKVDEIADDLHKKVPFEICDHREAEMKQMLRDHDIRMRQGGI